MIVDTELASCSIQLGLSTKAVTGKHLQVRKKPEHRFAEVSIEGFASPELVRRELHSADIVVMPSRMEVEWRSHFHSTDGTLRSRRNRGHCLWSARHSQSG